MSTVSVVRVYIKEGDKHEGHDLMKDVFRMLHDAYKVHGVTAFRGIAGFGSKGKILRADDIMYVNAHLPLVLEFFDEPDTVDALMPTLQEMIPANHILRWEAECGCPAS